MALFFPLQRGEEGGQQAEASHCIDNSPLFDFVVFLWRFPNRVDFALEPDSERVSEGVVHTEQRKELILRA